MDVLPVPNQKSRQSAMDAIHNRAPTSSDGSDGDTALSKQQKKKKKKLQPKPMRPSGLDGVTPQLLRQQRLAREETLISTYKKVAADSFGQELPESILEYLVTPEYPVRGQPINAALHSEILDWRNKLGCDVDDCGPVLPLQSVKLPKPGSRKLSSSNKEGRNQKRSKQNHSTGGGSETPSLPKVVNKGKNKGKQEKGKDKKAGGQGSKDSLNEKTNLSAVQPNIAKKQKIKKKKTTMQGSAPQQLGNMQPDVCACSYSFKKPLLHFCSS